MTKGLDLKTMTKHCESMCVTLEGGRHHSAPQLSIPAEATARTAKLLAAVLAVLPVGCGGFDLVAATPTRRTAKQADVLYWADPFLIIMVLLFLLQAGLFMKLGAWLAGRGRRSTEMKLKAVAQELTSVRGAHQRLCAQTTARSVDIGVSILLTTTGDKAHLSRVCPSLSHPGLNCQRLGPAARPHGTT